MKRSFFQAAVTSILLYGCTTWTLTKRLGKKLDANYTRLLRAVLAATPHKTPTATCSPGGNTPQDTNCYVQSWRQHPTRHQLYGHANKTAGEEARRQLHKTATCSPGGNTPQDTNCTATLSRKLFKLDEPDMLDTAGEAGTNS